MGIAALTLGIVGLLTWILPPLAILVSIVGFILGTIALITSKHQKGRAIAGIIMCVISGILSVGVIVGLVTAGIMFEELLRQYLGF